MDTATVTGRTAVLTRFERVLAPLDGSQQAEAVVRWLHRLPTGWLTLLRVCDDCSLGEAEAYLSDARERLGPPDCVVETRAVIGCPAESIVAAAAGIGLVAMSTRGAGGGGRLLFGSVADRVARHSPSPTLLLREGSVPESSAAVSRIVVPLDGSHAAERAVPVALDFAAAFGCSIHLVTVDEPASAPETTAMTTASLDRVAGSARRHDLTASLERLTGEPGPRLLETVAVGDLLVLTTHGRGAARRWQIGSVAEKLLRQAAAPVVLVRADAG